MLLRADRVLLRGAARPRFTAESATSNSPGGAFLCAHLPVTRMLASCGRCSPRSNTSGVTSPLNSDALRDAGAVAHLEEVELAARTLGVDPAGELDLLPDVLREILNVDVLSHDYAYTTPPTRGEHSFETSSASEQDRAGALRRRDIRAGARAGVRLRRSGRSTSARPSRGTARTRPGPTSAPSRNGSIPASASDSAGGTVILNLFAGLTQPHPADARSRCRTSRAAGTSRATAASTRFTCGRRNGPTATPLTAHDFEYSWKRVLDRATASKYASFLFPLKNAEAFNAGQGAARRGRCARARRSDARGHARAIRCRTFWT